MSGGNAPAGWCGVDTGNFTARLRAPLPERHTEAELGWARERKITMSADTAESTFQASARRT
jgi:hypothetical protein